MPPAGGICAPGNTAGPCNASTTTNVTPAVLGTNGSIAGRIWYDANGDDRFGAGEVGRPGWPVQLYNGPRLVATTTSDAGGAYSFTNLPAGTYTVRFAFGGGPIPVSGQGTPVPGGGTPARSQLSGIVLTQDLRAGT